VAYIEIIFGGGEIMYDKNLNVKKWNNQNQCPHKPYISLDLRGGG